MKRINLDDWTICTKDDSFIIQDTDKAALFDNEKNLILILTITKDKSLQIEKCAHLVHCEVDFLTQSIDIDFF